MRARRKLKNQRGFSLAETLLAVLILLLVSAIVAEGIPAAKNVYNKVIIGSNAQLLLSTSITALRNELATAKDIQVTGSAILYYKASINAYSKIFLDGSPASIKVYDYVDPNGDGWPAINTAEAQNRAPRDLVSDAAANKDLYITFSGVDEKSDMVVFDKLQVIRKVGSDSPIAELGTLNIRLIPLTDETETEP